ncbi:MAG: hypothetical protein K2N91_06515 [Muribaculaceae bacterium]|nr:hypothetical protein [Muribaculaceae bacterium]
MKRLLMSLCLIVSGICVAYPQSPSIASILNALTASSNVESVAQMLNAAGYTYRFEVSGYQAADYVFSKNCTVVHEEYSNGLNFHPNPENANSSIVVVHVTIAGVRRIEVNAYSNAEFRKWISQLKALGYKSTSDGGSGNRGRAWEYAAKGKPDVSIWNDYSNTYVLSISLDKPDFSGMGPW